MQYIRRARERPGKGNGGLEWDIPVLPKNSSPWQCSPAGGRAGHSVPTGKWDCIPKAEHLHQDGLCGWTGHRAPPKCTFLAIPGCSGSVCKEGQFRHDPALWKLGGLW